MEAYGSCVQTGSDQPAGNGRAEDLERNVQNASRQGCQAAEECRYGDGWVEMGSGDRTNGIDKQRKQENHHDAADQARHNRARCKVSALG